MKAFVEALLCPSCIVRVGKDCDSYGKPFEYAVAVAIPWRSFIAWLLGYQAEAIVKALVATEAKPLTQTHARAIIRALRDIGLKATWERIK
jgi:hypothetical protein